MVTFKDLKIGDSIYEVDIESKQIWINKIEDVSVNEFYVKFKCFDQYGTNLDIDIFVQDLNKAVCKYGSVYSTNLNLLLTAICNS